LTLGLLAGGGDGVVRYWSTLAADALEWAGALKDWQVAVTHTRFVVH